MKRGLFVVVSLFAPGHARLVLRAERTVLGEQTESSLEATEHRLASRMSTSAVSREVVDANVNVNTVMATLRTAAHELEAEFHEAKPLDIKKTGAQSGDNGISKAQHPGVLHLTAGAKKRLSAQQDALEKLFAKLKRGITKANTKEKDNKDDVAKFIATAEAKVKQDHEKLKSPKLSAWQHAALVNRTRVDENQLKYWKRGRELQHSMFHSNLKMAHGLMSRVKKVLAAYSHAMDNGTLDAKARADIKRSLASVPRAFLQTQHRLRRLQRAHRRHHGRAAAWYEEWSSSHRDTGHRLFRNHAV